MSPGCPAIAIRLLQTCARLTPQLRDNEQRREIHDLVEAVHDAAARSLDVQADRLTIEETYGLACELLAKTGK